MKNFKVKNVKLAFAILIILAIITLILFYQLVLSKLLARNGFENEMIEISDENESSIFNIQKIISYSNANAIDNSEDQSLKDVSICQYTDLSIYIDNGQTVSDLTDENTVKELYIDNIVINSNSDIGAKSLSYKNPLDFGKYKDFESNNSRIYFNIVNTNEENENNNYDNPTFYTDCSNPITLGYINKNIIPHYSVSDDASTISFNGKVLQEANIKTEDINYTLNFTIHIVNKLNQKFAYNMKLDINLNDENGGIYNGYTYKAKSTSGSAYRFFREF